MATFDTVAADAMLKVVTDGALFDSVVTHSRVIDLFEENSNVVEGPHGRYVELAHMFGYNEAVGARSENAFLPVPGIPTFQNGRVKLKKTLAVAQMTQTVMKQAMAGKAAFADWADVELRRTERALRDNLDRQAIGFGSGAVCRIDGAPTTVLIPIDAPYGLANDTKGWLPGLRRGQTIVSGPTIDGLNLRANGQSATIISVDKDANGGGGQLTVDAVPSGWVNNDFLFFGDDLGNSAAENGVDVEMQGLEGMIDDGGVLVVFQNINRDSFPEWEAQQIDASAAPYSALAKDTLFMQMNDDAVEQGGSDGLTHFLVTRAVFRNVYVQLKGDGGFGATQQRAGMEAATKGIRVWIGDQQVEIRAMPKLFPGRVFGLDRSTLRRYHLEGFEWDDTTGAIFKQVAVGSGIKDAFYAYGRVVMELGNTDPQKNAKSTGLSETQA